MRSGFACRAWLGAATLVAVATATATAMALAAEEARSDPVADFYKDKTITLYIGMLPGDGYDVTARLTARHLVEHIPGKPNMLPRNMPGAGGRNVMTHVYNITPRDGTVVATIEQSLPLQQALGEKFQFDSTQINLAMERGEVDGRTNTLASFKSVNPDWMREKKINILVQIALSKFEELPDVPLLLDLATNDEDRTLLRLMSTSATIGRSLVSTPAVPADRAQALRRAFDATMKDPRFREDAVRAKIDYNPMTGEELERIVADIMATPRPLADRLAGLLGGIGEGR